MKTRMNTPERGEISTASAIERYDDFPSGYPVDRQRMRQARCSAGNSEGHTAAKSFLLLALVREVAAFDGVWANAPTLSGGILAGHGVAIYVTAGDDATEVHNRLNPLRPIPDRLYVLPMPDAGGAVPCSRPIRPPEAPRPRRHRWRSNDN